MVKSYNEYITEQKKSISNLTVYHGSNARFGKFEQSKARIFNDFYGGGVAYFTENKKVGINYARGMAIKTGEPFLYECKLTLRNIFDVDVKFTGKELAKLVDEIGGETFARNAGLLKINSNKYKIIRELSNGTMTLLGDKVFKGLSATITTAKAREILIKNGYDGLRYNGGVNMNMQQKHDVYLPYKASSIKVVNRFKVKKK